MSREIDRSKPLSKADAKYLSDLALLSPEEEAKYGIKPTPDGGSADLGENTGDVNTVSADEDDETVPESYDEWSKDALAEEAEVRGLAKSGSKNDLIERLEAYDAEHADEDEE